jgi:thiamine pyrophosphokinase
LHAMIVSGGTVDTAFVSAWMKQNKTDAVIAADRGLHALREAGIRPDHVVGDFDSLPKNEILPSDPSIEVRRFNPVKDDTDTGIAVSLALELGAGQITMFGATGTRMDHQMANMALLRVIAARGAEGCILDPYNRITLLARSADASAGSAAVAMEKTSCADESARLLGREVVSDSALFTEAKQSSASSAEKMPGGIFCSKKERDGKLVCTLKKSLQFGRFVSFVPAGGCVTGLTLTGFKYPLHEKTVRMEETQLMVSNEIIEEEAVAAFARGALYMIESRD